MEELRKLEAVRFEREEVTPEPEPSFESPIEELDIASLVTVIYPDRVGIESWKAVGEEITPEITTAEGVLTALEREFRVAPEEFIEDLYGRNVPLEQIEQFLTHLRVPVEGIESVFTYFEGRDVQEGKIEEFESLIQAIFPERELEDFINFVETDFEGFLDEIRIKGRTKETQDLLLAIGFSWEDQRNIFATERLFMEVDGVRQLVTVDPRGNVSNDKGVHVGRYERGEFVPYSYRIGDTWKSVEAGWGDVIRTTGKVYEWIGKEFNWVGYQKGGQGLSEFGEFLQLQGPPDTLGEFDWTHLYNPRWWATKAPRAVTFTMALIPPMLLGKEVGLAAGAALGLGRFGTFMLEVLGTTLFSRPMESALEAGSAFDEARLKGLSDEEAIQAAREVFINNLKLAGVDAAQFALAFAPTPTRVFEGLITKGLVRTVTIGGKVFFTGLSEAGEEYYQEIIQRRALGEEIVWDAEMKEVVAIGAIIGIGLGAGGDVLTNVQNRVKDRMAPKQRISFDQSIRDAINEGLNEDEAEKRAWDEIIADKEVQQIVKDVVEEVKIEELEKEIKPDTEADKIVWEHNFDKMREEAGIVPEVEPTIETELASWERFRDDLEREIPTLTGEAKTKAQADLEAANFRIRELQKRRGVTEVVAEAEPIVHRGTEPEGIAIADELEVRYDGIQEGIEDIPSKMMFTDVRQTRTTFVANTLEEARTKLAEKRELFKPPAVEEVPAPAEVAWEELGFAEERVPVEEGGVPIDPDRPLAKGAVDNTVFTKDIGAKERIRPSRHVFEKMGLYPLWKGIQRAEVELGEARATFQKKLNEMSKLVDKDRRYLVFRELENPGSIVGLTFDEKRAVNWFRGFFDKWANDLDLPQSKRRQNYVTHIFEEDITQQIKEEHPLSPEMTMAMEDKTAKTIFNPFLQDRLGKMVGLVEDPFAAAGAYEARQLKVLHYEPFLQRIAAIANDPKSPPLIRDYLKDYSRRMTGEPSKLDKGLNNTIQELAEVVRKLPKGEGLANILSKGNVSGWASYNLTSTLYTLWLGFKPTSAIRNLGQHTLIMAEVGPVHFANGIRLRFTKEGKAVLAESLVLRSRKTAFLPGIDDSFRSRWGDKFRETALWMFRKADQQNVSDAFLAGYSEAKSLLPNADRQVWIDRGDEVAADTQYLYTKMNSFQLSQNSVGRVFSMLTTWTENWMELMTKWVSRRPSQVYTQYEKATGKKVTRAPWGETYQAILLYILITGLGKWIKEETRFKAWEYTGFTSLRYLAGVAGGEFPALEAPGAVMDFIIGFTTGDERMMKSGWNQLKSVFTPGVLRQLNNVVEGEKDWLTLFFYLEGKDIEIRRLKNKWEKDFKPYEDLSEFKVREELYSGLTVSQARSKWREDNPLEEAKMFVLGQFTTLSSEKARQEVLRLIEEHKLDTELIPGYDKVFGVDTKSELNEFQGRIGRLEKFVVGEEAEYFDVGSFITEVHNFVRTQGENKVRQDGQAFAVAILDAENLLVPYFAYEEAGARKLYRQLNTDAEAWLYLMGKIGSFENPESAKELLELMDKYNIPPQAINAFQQDPSKYDELFTQKFELQQANFELDTLYDNYGNSESDVYIEDSEVRKEVRDKLKEDNPEWVANLRRIEAIDNDASPEGIEKWVDRGKTIDEFGAGSSEAKVWLLDNPEVNQWALDNELLTDDGSDWNENVLRINVEWATQDDEYNAIDGAEARQGYLLADVDYAKARRRRDAYGIEGFPEEQIETYVGYYTLPKKPDDWLEGVGYYVDDWFLQDNPEFHQALVDFGIFKELKDLSKVPTREIFEKWWVYNKLTNQMDKDTYRLENPNLDEWGVSVEIWTRTMTEKRRRARITPSERFLEDVAERERAFREMLRELFARLGQ